MEEDPAEKTRESNVEPTTKGSRGKPTARTKTSDAQNASASKRRCVSTACIACRRRKSKCDGNIPSCAACSSVYHTTCVYDPNSDHRRKGVYKKDTDTMRTRNSTLQTLIQAMLNYEEDDAFELLRQIRSCDNLEDVAEAIITREKGFGAEGNAASSDEDLTHADQFESELAGKMSELMLDGSRKFIGGTSNLIFLPPGSELYEFNSTLDENHKDDYSMTRWTKVTDDEQLISHLLTMYFTWHYPVFTTLSKDLFYRDYVSGTSSQYCSPLLVNTMLALGCHFSSWEGAREDPQNSGTAGDHFFKEAKRLVLENDEHVNAKLCTVQALALMSVREAGCGREGKGWVYSGMSFRMAFDLGLNLDASRIGSHSLGEEEIDARRITFWGCFLFDKCWSNYLGRQPQLLSSNASVPKIDVLPNEDAELWSPYTDTGVGHEHTQPSRTRAISLQVAKLSEISGDLIIFFYHPTPTEKPPSKQQELKRLSEIHTRLEAWKKSLPKELDSKEGQLPQALVMHMFYQLLYIHLYRPFLKYTKSASPLPQHVSPRKLCTLAASAISKLLRIYKRNYGFNQVCNIVVYIAHTACTVHLLNLPEKNAQRDVIHALRNLEEMGESWLCARRTLRILDISANKWQVTLPNEAVTIFERTHTKWGSWGPWDQATSPSTSEESPSVVAAQPAAAAPSSFSSPGIHVPAVQPNGSSTSGHPNMVGVMAPQFQPGSSVAASLSAIRQAHRSLSAQLQRTDSPLPEPTYLRPVSNAYHPVHTSPLSQHDAWYNTNGNQMRPLNTTRHNTPSTTTASPITGFEAPENLVEESQNWWSRNPNAMNLGMENWPEGWTTAGMPGAPSLRYEGRVPTTTVGQNPTINNRPRPTQPLNFPVPVTAPNASNAGQDLSAPGYNNILFPGNYQQ